MHGACLSLSLGSGTTVPSEVQALPSLQGSVSSLGELCAPRRPILVVSRICSPLLMPGSDSVSVPEGIYLSSLVLSNHTPPAGSSLQTGLGPL